MKSFLWNGSLVKNVTLILFCFSEFDKLSRREVVGFWNFALGWGWKFPWKAPLHFSNCFANLFLLFKHCLKLFHYNNASSSSSTIKNYPTNWISKLQKKFQIKLEEKDLMIFKFEWHWYSNSRFFRFIFWSICLYTLCSLYT